MTCEVYKLLIDELGDESLNDDLKPHIYQHMDTCPTCRTYSESVTLFMEAAEHLPMPLEMAKPLRVRERSFWEVTTATVSSWMRTPVYSMGATFAFVLTLGALVNQGFLKNKEPAVEQVSLQAKVDEPTVVRFNFKAKKNLKNATLVLSVLEGTEFVGKNIENQRVLRLSLDLQKGDNLIPVVVKSHEKGVHPIVANVFHPEFQKSALISMDYRSTSL